MTVCQHEKFIKAWLDGELDPGRALALDRHLAECAACRSTIADYRRICERLHVLALEPAPRLSIDKVFTGVERERREEVHTLRLLKRVCAAAAAILIVATAGLLVPPGAQPGFAPPESGLDEVLAVALVEPPLPEDF